MIETNRQNKSTKGLENEILDNLIEANESLEKDDFPNCEYHLSQAKRGYSKALYAAPLRWRFFNEYGGPIWIYLILILGGVFMVFYFHRNPLATSIAVDPSALNAAAWGVIGAVLRTMWFFSKVKDFNSYF